MTSLFALQIFFIPGMFLEWMVEFGIAGRLFGLLHVYSVVFFTVWIKSATHQLPCTPFPNLMYCSSGSTSECFVSVFNN